MNESDPIDLETLKKDLERLGLKPKPDPEPEDPEPDRSGLEALLEELMQFGVPVDSILAVARNATPEPMDQPPPKDLDDSAQRGTWAKIEIMGHDTFYGFVRPSEYLESGIRVDVLPSGDGEDKMTFPRHWGEKAIFSITPLSEREARRLSRRRYYTHNPLDRAEQRQLIGAELTLDVAKDWVRENGFRIEEMDDSDDPEKDLPF